MTWNSTYPITKKLDELLNKSEIVRQLSHYESQKKELQCEICKKHFTIYGLPKTTTCSKECQFIISNKQKGKV